jgi:pyruvate/2-oxoglutarate dehydrogenase complex dihydrolipoamide dehydrogenase (E3) component
MALKHYDVIVVGAGPAGWRVAIQLVKNGMSAALVENELVGGECHFWACIPSKALLRPPEALTEANEVEDARQAVHGRLSAESVLSRRDRFADQWDDSKVKGTLEKGGVVILRGQGQLDGPKRVIISSNNDDKSNTKTLVAKQAVVLSTGSRATIPKVKGLTEAQPWTNRNATGAKKAPSSLAIMGDGAVGCEMAHAWWSLGTKVTIISKHDRILNKFEPFVGERLMEVFKHRGISVRTNVNVKEVERPNHKQDHPPLNIKLDDGTTITADELLVAVGRTPNTDKLGLEAVGLKPGNWLQVDDTCLVQGVEGDWLYALGDINQRALLTHIGNYQARACAHAIIARAHGALTSNNNNGESSRSSNSYEPWNRWVATADHVAVPQVIFTDPQIASVGFTEKDARRLNINVRAVDYEIDTLQGASLHTDGYTGRARIIVNEDRHVIIGATLIGPQVGELLHPATIAIICEIPLERLWHAVPSFPTMSEVWLHLLENYGL